MKKITFFLTFVFVAIFTNNVFATDYDLWIVGVQVTDENMSNITGAGISGTISYDPTTKTLTLNNATIISNDNHGIRSDIDSLTILVMDTTIIFLPSDNVLDGLRLGGFTTITGDGILSITAVDDGISFSKDLTISDITLDIAADYGFYGQPACKLSINNAIVFIDVEANPIRTYYLELIGVDFITPIDAFYDDDEMAVMYYDNDFESYVFATEVVIAPVYDLWIAGERVCKLNKNDVAYYFDDYNYVDGNISYDPTTKTLTLEDAIIMVDGDFGENYIDAIRSKIPGLTIMVRGENTLMSFSTGNDALNLRGTTISGDGTLYLIGEDDGITFSDTLIVNDVTIETYSDYGIYNNQGHLIINNATIDIHSAWSALTAGKIELNGVAVIAPEDAEFIYDEEHEVYRCMLDEEYVKRLLIAPTSPIDPETAIADAAAAASNVNIFPNPATNVLNVQADGFQTLEIINFLGQKVYSSDITNSNMQINVTDFNAGVYFVRLNGEGKDVTQKVMVY